MGPVVADPPHGSSSSRSSSAAHRSLILVLQVNTVLFLLNLLPPSSCLAMVTLQPLDRGDVAALQAVRSWLRDGAPSTKPSFFSSWNFSYDPCSFEGVLCDHSAAGGASRVVSLNLGSAIAGSAGLRGRLHPALGSLSELLQLSLSPGRVAGLIPRTIGQLCKLQNLGLSHNRLAGTVPPQIGDLKRLIGLDFSFNRLTGGVPESLAALPSLISLGLAHNRLGGYLPASFSGAMALEQIDLRRNSFMGALPTTLPPSLQRLILSHNKLTGTLHPILSAPQLTFIDLSRNQLSGMIPAQIFSLPSLSSLLLSWNHLAGDVAPNDSVRISTLDLSFNELTGSISPRFAFVQNLLLNNNRFAGEVPAQFAEELLAASMKTLFLQHNYLTGFPPVAAESLPLTASLCIRYNCMPPPVDSLCPQNAGSQSIRPSDQCIP